MEISVQSARVLKSNGDGLGDIRYVINHAKRILYAERHDSVTRGKVYAEWQAMQELDGFDPSYDSLVDYSEAPSVALDYEDVKALGRDMMTLDPRTGNVAIVSGPNIGRYCLARFYCVYTNTLVDRKHQVFMRKADAEAWLLSLRNRD